MKPWTFVCKNSFTHTRRVSHTSSTRTRSAISTWLSLCSLPSSAYSRSSPSDRKYDCLLIFSVVNASLLRSHFRPSVCLSVCNARDLLLNRGLHRHKYTYTLYIKQNTDSGARHLYVRISNSRSAIGFRYRTILIYTWIKPLGAAKTYLYVFWICRNYPYQQHNPTDCSIHLQCAGKGIFSEIIMKAIMFQFKCISLVDALVFKGNWTATSESLFQLCPLSI